MFANCKDAFTVATLAPSDPAIDSNFSALRGVTPRLASPRRAPLRDPSQRLTHQSTKRGVALLAATQRIAARRNFSPCNATFYKSLFTTPRATSQLNVPQRASSPFNATFLNPTH